MNKKDETFENNIIDSSEYPSMGQFRCIPCDRYFVDQFTMDEHKKSKVHKRRIKLLKEDPYTQLEAERAAGMTR